MTGLGETPVSGKDLEGNFEQRPKGGEEVKQIYSFIQELFVERLLYARIALAGDKTNQHPGLMS